MNERRILPVKVLKREKQQVFQFILNHVKPDPRRRGVPIADIFQAYKNEYKTVLTVDGFGRLFPKGTFTRKNIGYDGKTHKSVVGVRLI